MKLDDKLKLIYPSLFPIKVFVANEREAIEHIESILGIHMEILETTISIQNSSKANYACLNINFLAKSEEHIQSFYLDIKKHKSVKMVI